MIERLYSRYNVCRTRSLKSGRLQEVNYCWEDGGFAGRIDQQQSQLPALKASQIIHLGNADKQGC